jgi:hypothetical protein
LWLFERLPCLPTQLPIGKPINKAVGNLVGKPNIGG